MRARCLYQNSAAKALRGVLLFIIMERDGGHKKATPRSTLLCTGRISRRLYSNLAN